MLDSITVYLVKGFFLISGFSFTDTVFYLLVLVYRTLGRRSAGPDFVRSVGFATIQTMKWTTFCINEIVSSLGINLRTSF